MKPGFSIRVIPGYTHLNGPQRNALLSLAEAGELESPVKLRKVGGCWQAVDKRGRSWQLLYTGSVQPTPPR